MREVLIAICIILLVIVVSASARMEVARQIPKKVVIFSDSQEKPKLGYKYDDGKIRILEDDEIEILGE